MSTNKKGEVSDVNPDGLTQTTGADVTMLTLGTSYFNRYVSGLGVLAEPCHRQELSTSQPADVGLLVRCLPCALKPEFAETE